MFFSINKIKKSLIVKNQQNNTTLNNISMDCEDNFENMPHLLLPISIFSLQKLNNINLKNQLNCEKYVELLHLWRFKTPIFNNNNHP